MISLGIWTDGIDSPPMSGPWMGLHRTLREVDPKSADFDITLIHCGESDKDIYSKFDELIVSKNIQGKLRIQQSEIDAVFLNTIPSTLPSMLFHTYPNMKIVGWMHGTLSWVPKYAYGEKLVPTSPRQRIRNQITKYVMRQSIKKFDLLFVPSEFSKEVFVAETNVDEDNIVANHYGVDKSVFKPYLEQVERKVMDRFDITSPFLLFVGRCIPRKSPMTALQSFDIIRNKGHEYELVMAGTEYEASKAKKFVDDHGLENKVTFTGFQDEQIIAELYSASDALIFPTLHETFGMPLLEAMAAGTPVISTDCTVVPEVTGEAAVLVDDPTDPQELANAIEKIIENKGYREQLIEEGLNRSNQLSWQNTAKRFVSSLESELNP